MSHSGPVPDGISWRGYDGTIEVLRERLRPVLLFVWDEDCPTWPFLREIFSALPRNQKLRARLASDCAPMLLKAGEIPELLSMLGAGANFHIAILSPSGFTPLTTFNPVTAQPDSLVDEIATAVNAVVPHWSI